ncbi:hypothetical protein WICPIJ_001527 [Wickerhamomyces pijperi]|uniref:MADS-box domain-containing protein n=1 Tax=Wickerhamomyces pijperi TaxID=599730 RepID=A0A9P8TQI4_WICPI|nr:hypothetical protein WICPIJ_001527 [Wickerhamomyces pijperi]
MNMIICRPDRTYTNIISLSHRKISELAEQNLPENQESKEELVDQSVIGSSVGNEDLDDDDDKPSGARERRKIEIKFIQDKSRRHITFSKRKAGIMKKAYELSVLTGTQVLLLVVSETGLVYTFTTPKLQPLVTKPEGKNLIQACLNAPEDAGEEEEVQTPTNQQPTPAQQQQQQQQPTAAQQVQQQQAQQQAQQQQQQANAAAQNYQQAGLQNLPQNAGYLNDNYPAYFAGLNNNQGAF